MVKGKTTYTRDVHLQAVGKMARIDVILPDELEKKFRETVFKRKGMRRGNMTEAIKEAIQLWVEAKPKKKA